MNWIYGRHQWGEAEKLKIETHHLVPRCRQAGEGSLRISVLVFSPSVVTGFADETTGCS